jgi:hypothetical protein
LPLFIDPYALSTREDQFSIECNSIIVNFFQGVIDDIKNENFQRAKHNLDKLSEPNDTHLGLSRRKSRGRGVSGEQSVDLFDRLKESKAVQTGFLKDLSDCELVIPGISRDKISDIVTNIIKIKLIEYTKEQCHTYSIPTSSIPSGRYWNPEKGIWDQTYEEMPSYRGARIVFVPKAIVRYSIEFCHPKYYNGFVLEFLQTEHINANTGLVRILKNGNHVVRKKDLKEQPQYQMSKDFLYHFSREHPEVMRKYINSLPETISSLSDSQIEEKQIEKITYNYDDLKTQLSNIPPGKQSENTYHNLMIGIIGAIFYPSLIIPIKEERIHEGRKRIDITYQNAAKSGFFEFLSKHVPCPFVVVECKNYTDDPQNPEIDQLSGRFSPRRGQFGILVCREIADKDLMHQRCKDTATDARGYMVALDDTDILSLLDMKKNNDEKSIENFLLEKYKKLVI